MNINMSAKHFFKFYVKILNNIRATVCQIAIPYDSKVKICLKLDTILSYCDRIFLSKNQKQITLGALLFVWH